MKSLEDKDLVLDEIRCLKEETGMKLQHLDDKVLELKEKVVHMDHSIEEVKTILLQMSKGTCINKKARQRRYHERSQARRFQRNRRLKNSSYTQLRRGWQSKQTDPTCLFTHNVSIDLSDKSEESNIISVRRDTKYSKIMTEDHDNSKLEEDICTGNLAQNETPSNFLMGDHISDQI